ncbi:hypothetical protein NR798_47440 [Archangium gephyra]|uniref:hypothetical protein n=1 Tax=Archangium gephyra TaxID=48 RepID=UPI0035D50CA0
MEGRLPAPSRWPAAVTSWNRGVGNTWTVECTGSKVQLKSWKGDSLHRPDTAQGVTSWNTGTGNEWALQVVP